jgi:hypothetical protein
VVLLVLVLLLVLLLVVLMLLMLLMLPLLLHYTLHILCRRAEAFDALVHTNLLSIRGLLYTNRSP